MKNLFYISLILLMLPYTGLAQNDSIITKKEVPNFKNQIDLDFEVLAFSLSYKRRVSDNWLIGPNIGLGVNLSLVSVSSYGASWGAEYAHIGIVAKNYSKNNKWCFEIESKISGIYSFGLSENEGAFIAGIGLGIYYGKKVQFGLRTTIGTEIDDFRNRFISSIGLVVVRVPIKW